MLLLALLFMANDKKLPSTDAVLLTLLFFVFFSAWLFFKYYCAVRFLGGIQPNDVIVLRARTDARKIRGRFAQENIRLAIDFRPFAGSL